ncbi:hypothetical protein GOODEAATRI_007715, partial [Goodea atripinnis]
LRGEQIIGSGKINKEGNQEKLKEIDMSEYDASTYERFSNAVRRQVQSLRIILDSLQVGSPQQKPKRLRVLADVSGSMYRFNGVDGRLERSMEAVCMVMEALESYEHKFKAMVEILPIRFCMSGDYTLEATDASIKQLAQEEADEHFVVVLSDANLERYGIRPERFSQVLTSDPQVNAFAIFIGSLGDQAER